MSRHRNRHPELVVADTRPRLTPLNQLLAENMLKTTRLYVRRRARQSAQLLARKPISYWLEQKQPRSKASSYANSACDRLFAVQELADAIFVHLDFHDTSCCLAVSRAIRDAAQRSLACVRSTIPLIECEDPHLLYMEQQLDLTTSTADWQKQRFFINTGNIVFPRNAPAPLLVSIYDIVNTIGEPWRRRVNVDMWFSATGHTPQDFTLDGSWLDLALPLPDTVVWKVNITCDCHRTDSFLNALDFSEEVDTRTYKDGTRIAFPYKLVTENGDHLKQIARYAKKAYRLHRHCRTDYNDVSSGLSSITFKALKRNQSGFDLIDTSTHSTRPSPKFRAKSSIATTLQSLDSMFTETLPPAKTRRETLNDIEVELATPREGTNWDLFIERSTLSDERFTELFTDNNWDLFIGGTLSDKLFTGNIPSEEFVYTLEKLGRLSTWDRFMGRTELKLGY
jgi:hypothetical protein